MGILNYFRCGKKCFDIVTENIPQKLEDGILTIDEMATIIKDICAVFDIKAEIQVPSKYTDKYFDIVGYDEMKSSH